MLTKDLLRVRLNGDYLKPCFLDRDCAEWLELAAELTGLYENGTGESAGTLDSAAEACVLRCSDIKIARGLLKVIRARADFSGEGDDFPYPDERRTLFLKTAERIRNQTLPADARAVRDAVFAGQPSPLRERGLYSDLPENERLIRFRRTFPQEAVDRYNVGLVQGLLLTADSLDLNVPASTPPAALRALFRSMKFFRLLFSGRLERGTLQLHVDGPASILENSLKYGLQLACFFPSVCRLPEWKLTCRIRRSGKVRKLNLDQTSGLRSMRAQFTGPVEEHRMFLEFFRTRQTGWEIDDAPGYLETGAQMICFPDFSFRKDGRTFYLELFHRWHAVQLEERLRWCAEHPEGNLLIGVDRSLLKKDGILAKQLEDDSCFSRNGFFFRDFPGMDNVLKLLNRQE